MKVEMCILKGKSGYDFVHYNMNIQGVEQTLITVCSFFARCTLMFFFLRAKILEVTGCILCF